jgi:phosphoribosylformimino-5-aminoimidazole carboxamide ribotide isomerase
MKIYFVMDLKEEKVVRAFRGERESYQPVHLSTDILRDSNPLSVVDEVNPRYLYVADLDRISDRGNNFRIIEMLSGKVEHLVADCGLREVSDAKNLKFDVVFGSETFDLRKIEDSVKYVSLDIRNNFIDASGSFEDWFSALDWLNSYELEGIIILDLSRVGTMSSELLIFEKAAGMSDNPLYAGGGIKSTEDIKRLEEIGYDGVLIAGAVYGKKIGVEVVRRGVL